MDYPRCKVRSVKVVWGWWNLRQIAKAFGIALEVSEHSGRQGGGKRCAGCRDSWFDPAFSFAVASLGDLFWTQPSITINIFSIVVNIMNVTVRKLNQNLIKAPRSEHRVWHKILVLCAWALMYIPNLSLFLWVSFLNTTQGEGHATWAGRSSN
jgi:hypothetical protein